jgi:Na+/H+ antiporter NhaC
MASAGAQCNHVNHVSTQLPYAILVAAVSCVSYVVAGFSRSAPVSLLFGAVLLIASLAGIRWLTARAQQ